METEVQDILNNLFSNQITDPQDLEQDLKQLLKRTQEQSMTYSYLFIRLLDSKQSLITYLEQISTRKDNLTMNIKKTIIKFIISLITLKKDCFNDLIEFLLDKCLRMFKKEQSAQIKVIYLDLINKILKNFEYDKFKNIDLNIYFVAFFNEIEYMKPKGKVIGSIWVILAMLCYKFQDSTEEKQEQLKNLLIRNVQKNFYSLKPDIMCIVGCLKAFKIFLRIYNLEENEKLFKIIHAGIQKIEEIQHYKVIKASIKLFKSHMNIFILEAKNSEFEIYNILMTYIKGKNRRMKEVAMQCLIRFCQELAIQITENKDSVYYKTLLELFIAKLRAFILKEEDPQILMSAIQSYGAFAKAIKAFDEEAKLHENFYFLIENSESTLFMQIGNIESFHFQKNPQNFKQVLFNQKQLMSYIKSFSFIIAEMNNLNTTEINFLTKMNSMTLKYIVNFFPPYKKTLCINFVEFLNSLPTMNYNVFIIRQFFKDYFYNLEINSGPFEFENYDIYQKFLFKIFHSDLSKEKQNLIKKQYFEEINFVISKYGNRKEFLCINNKIKVENEEERRTFFIIRILNDLINNAEVRQNFNQNSENLIQLYNEVEKKIKQSPDNLMLIRILAILCRFETVQKTILSSKPIISQFFQIVDTIWKSFYKYKGLSILYYFEFIIQTSFTFLQLEKSNILDQMIQKYFITIQKIFENREKSLTQIIQALSLFGQIVIIAKKENQFKNQLDLTLNKAIKYLAEILKEQNNLIGNNQIYASDFIYNTEHIINKTFDIISHCNLSQKHNKKIQNIYQQNENDIEIIINNDTIKFQLENIFLFLSDNFSDKNYNLNPDTYNKLMYSLGIFVMQSNQQYRQKKHLKMKEIQILKSRERYLLDRILKVLKICFDKGLKFLEQSVEFLLSFLKSSMLDENFFDDIICPILLFFKQVMENSKSLIYQNEAFWQILEDVVIQINTVALNDSEQEKEIEDQFLFYIKSNFGQINSNEQLFNIKIFNYYCINKNISQNKQFFHIFFGFIEDLNLSKNFSPEVQKMICDVIRQIFHNFKQTLKHCISQFKKSILIILDSLEIRQSFTIQKLNFQILKYLITQLNEVDRTEIQKNIKFDRLCFLKKTLFDELQKDFLQKFVEDYQNFGNDEKICILKLLTLKEFENVLVEFINQSNKKMIDEHILLILNCNNLNDNLRESNKFLRFLIKDVNKRKILISYIKQEYFRHQIIFYKQNLNIYQFRDLLEIFYNLFQNIQQNELDDIIDKAFIRKSFEFVNEEMTKKQINTSNYQKSLTFLEFIAKLNKIPIIYLCQLIQKQNHDLSNIFQKNFTKKSQDQQSEILYDIFSYFFQKLNFKTLNTFLKNIDDNIVVKLDFKFGQILEQSEIIHYDENLIDLLYELSRRKIKLNEKIIYQLVRILNMHLEQCKEVNLDNVFYILYFVTESKLDSFSYYEVLIQKLQEQLHKNTSLQLDQIIESSKEYQTSTNIINKIFQIAERSQCFEYLEIIFFFLNSKQTCYYSHIVDQFESLMNNKNALEKYQLFFSKIMQKYFLNHEAQIYNYHYFLNMYKVFLQSYLAKNKSFCKQFVSQNFDKIFQILVSEDSNLENFDNLVKFLLRKQIFVDIIQQFYNTFNKNQDINDTYKVIVQSSSNFKQSDQPNEVTKLLVVLLAKLKLSKQKFLSIINNIEKQQQTRQTKQYFNFPMLIEILQNLLCDVYNCKIQIILKTQNNIQKITNHLIYQKEKNELVFDHLFDLKKEEYDFQVLTEFKVQAIKEEKKNKNTEKITNKELSFIQRMNRKLLSQESFLDDQEENDNYIIEKDVFEMDQINQHPIMTNFLDMLKYLNVNFDSERQMWLESINQVMIQSKTNFQMYIFMLKVLINNPQYFEEYKRDFLQHIFDYLMLDNNGGYGLHYFMRDIINLMTKWCEDINEFSLQQKDVDKIVFNIFRKLGDLSNIIFQNNIAMFEKVVKIFNKWGYKFEIHYILQLLEKKQNTETQIIEKTASIKVLIIYLIQGVKIIHKNDTNIYKFLNDEYLFRIVNLIKINSKQLNLLIGVLVGHYLNILKDANTLDYEKKIVELSQQIEINIPKLNQRLCHFIYYVIEKNADIFHKSSRMKQQFLKQQINPNRRQLTLMIKILHKVIQTSLKNNQQLTDITKGQFLLFAEQNYKHCLDHIYQIIDIFLLIIDLLKICEKNYQLRLFVIIKSILRTDFAKTEKFFNIVKNELLGILEDEKCLNSKAKYPLEVEQFLIAFLFLNDKNIDNIRQYSKIINNKYKISSFKDFLQFAQNFDSLQFEHVLTKYCIANCDIKSKDLYSVSLNDNKSKNKLSQILKKEQVECQEKIKNYPSLQTYPSQSVFTKDKNTEQFDIKLEYNDDEQQIFNQINLRQNEIVRFNKQNINLLPQRIKNVYIKQNSVHRSHQNIIKETEIENQFTLEQIMNDIFEKGIVVFDYFQNFVFKIVLLNYYTKSNSLEQKFILSTLFNLEWTEKQKKYIKNFNQLLFEFYKLNQVRFMQIIQENDHKLLKQNDIQLFIEENIITENLNSNNKIKHQQINKNSEHFLQIATNFSLSKSQNEIQKIINQYQKGHQNQNIKAIIVQLPIEDNVKQKIIELRQKNKSKEYLDLIDQYFQEDQKEEQIKQILENEKINALKTLQKWDDIGDYLLNDNNEQINELNLLNLDNLTQTKKELFFDVSLYKKQNWGHLKQNLINLLNKEKKNNLEENFTKQLIFAVLTQSDIQRANYYNEQFKQRIRKNLWKFQVKNWDFQQKFKQDIQMYAKTKKFIHYYKGDHQLQNEEQFQELLDVFIQPTEHIQKNFDFLQFEKSYNNLLLDLIDVKLQEDQREVLIRAKASNILSFVQNLIDINYLETAEIELKKLLQSSKIKVLGFEDLNFQFTNLFTTLKKQQILREVQSPYQIKEQSILKFIKGNQQFCFSENYIQKFDILYSQTYIFFQDKKSQDYDEQIFKEDMLCQSENLINEMMIESDRDEFNLNMNYDLSQILQKILRQKMNKKKQNHTFNTEEMQVLSSYIKSLIVILQQNPQNHQISFLLQLIQRYGQTVTDILQQYEKHINSKVFLKWIPQIIDLIERKDDQFFLKIVQNLINTETGIISVYLNFYKQKDKVRKIINNHTNILSKYFEFFEEIEQNFNDPQIIALNILKRIVEQLENDKNFELGLEKLNKMLIKKNDNEFYQKFISRYFSKISCVIQDLEKMKTENIQKVVDSSILKIQKNNLVKDINKLIKDLDVNLRSLVNSQLKKISYYSVKFDNFRTYFQELQFFANLTINKDKIKILNINKKIQIINSKRKPKKIEFLCSDNKKRSLMIKSGEDLRSDERILTIFSLINSLLYQDNQNNDIKLKTFSIFPINKQLGMVEWIENSIPLKKLLEKSLREENMHQNSSFQQRNQFLLSYGSTIQQQYEKLYEAPDEIVIKQYDKEVCSFNPDILRRSFMSQFDNCEDFDKQRTIFLKQYALYSIVGYLLGIGDRHTENILFSKNLDVFFIDFASNFDLGMQLDVPELVPFRLTPNIIRLGLPFQMEGVFKTEMTKYTQILLNNKETLIDYIQIFLNDPLQEWQFLKTQVKGTFIENQIEIFQQKIEGINPAYIFNHQIEQNVKNQIIKQKAKIIMKQFDLNRSNYSSQAIVETLIKIATCKQFLGRMYLGWTAHVQLNYKQYYFISRILHYLIYQEKTKKICIKLQQDCFIDKLFIQFLILLPTKQLADPVFQLFYNPLELEVQVLVIFGALHVGAVVFQAVGAVWQLTVVLVAGRVQ